MTESERWVDLVFPARGEFILREYAALLMEQLCARLDCLREEPAAGIHPIRGVSESGDRLVLGGRAQVVVRLPERLVPQAERLHGSELDLGGPIVLGRGTVRGLASHPVLYSPCVATGDALEGALLESVERELAKLRVNARVVIGRRREVRGGRGVMLIGYSVLLHGLSAEDSLLMQNRGLGQERKLGCGLFVPHKSIASVGDE